MRTRSRSTNSDEQNHYVVKKSRRITKLPNNHSFDEHTTPTPTTAVQQNDVNASTINLLTYAFCLQSVAVFLNDGDVMARLLTTNKSVKRLLSQYSFKQVVDVETSLRIIESDLGISLSVTRVKASNTGLDGLLKAHRSNRQLDGLLKIHQTNKVPVTEVHYFYQDRLHEDRPLPPFATHITYLSTDCVSKLVPGFLPNGVIDLDIKSVWNSPVQVGVIPLSVKALKLCLDVTNWMPSLIPDSVTDLTLELQSAFAGHSIGDLTPGSLPTSLKYLKFGQCGKLVAPGVIPTSLTHLSCCVDLLSILEPGSIPDGVFHLTLESRHNPKIFKQPKPGVIPTSISHVVLNTAGILDLNILHTLPRLTHLCVRAGYDAKLSSDMIPASVTHMSLSCNDGLNNDCRITTNMIPDTVTHLCFDHRFDQAIGKGIIPRPVTHVVMGDRFDRNLSPHTFPRSVTHLCFGKTFDKPVRVSDIPSSVTHLVFGENFNQEIKPGVIPSSVRYLAFGKKFTQKLDEKVFPSLLRYLEIPRGYVKEDDKHWLPASLTHVSYTAKQPHERPDFASTCWNPRYGIFM